MTKDSAAAPQRRSWKQPHSTAHLKVEVQRTKRALVTLFGLLALAGFVLLLIYWFWPQAKLRVVTISATDYDPLEAPPIPYAAEDLGALQSLDPQRKSESNAVADAVASLGDTLQSTAGPKDNLLVYISAHGIHKAEGKDGASARLLLSDSEYRHNRGWVPLKQLLDGVSRSRAGTKLLVIDWGQLETDPRMGVLVNEFPLRLEEEIRGVPDPNLWVLTSHSLLERSHVSHDDRRSVFGYFLAKGLKGRADGFAGADVDLKVHLNELAGYVRHHVSQTVWRDSKNKETQTPQLYRGNTGLVDPTAANEVFLARSRPASEQQDPPRPANPAPSAAPDKPIAANLAPTSPAPAPPTTTTASVAPAPSATADAAASATSGAATGSPPSSGSPSASGSATPAGIATSSATPSASAAVAAATTNSTPSGATPTSSGVVATAGPQVDQRLDAALKESWAAIRREEAEGQKWTPIDFAPHLWRRYQELLRGYQDRVALGAISAKKISRDDLDGNKQKLLEEIQTAQARFEQSVAKRSYETHKIKSMVQLRNRVVFRAFDLVRVRDYEGTHRPLAPRLTDQQAVAIARVLDELRNSLVKELEKPLTTPTLAEARGGTEQSDWLTALGDDEERLRDLFRTLETEMQAVAKLDKPRIQSLGEITDATKGAGTVDVDRWKEARERARVECISALLGESAEKNSDLQGSVAALNRMSNTKADVVVYRALGDQLANFYATLPDRIGKLREAKTPLDLSHAEMLTRVALADDAQMIENQTSLVTGLPNPLTDWSLLTVHRQFTFRGPGEPAARSEEASPVRFDLNRATPMSWELSSNQALPQQIKVELEYAENLLEVFDGQRRIDKGVPFTIRVGPGAELASINLQVRALKTQKDPTTLTLTVDAAEGGKFTKNVRCEFPTPTQIEVRVFDALSGARLASTNPGAPYDRVIAGDRTPLNVLRLRPFPAGAGKTTDYAIRLCELSGRELKDVTVKLFAVPTPTDGGAKWNFEAKRFDDPLLPLPLWTKLSEATATLPAASAEIPMPLKSPGTVAPKDGATAAPQAPPPAPMNVNGGLVCVLEFKEPGGTDRRECVWLDVDPRHPETYVRPEVTAKVDQTQGGEVGVEVIVRLQDGIKIPETGFEITMNTTLPPGESLPNKRTFSKITKSTTEATLFMPVRGDAAKTFDLWLDVDGYPRAFAYEDVSCTTKRNFERTLEPKRALEFVKLTGLKKNPPPPAAPDAKSTNEAERFDTPEGKRLFSFSEAIAVKLRADAHPLADERYRIQIGLKNRADRVTFHSDRMSDVILMPVETGALRLESTIKDLEAVLDMRGLSDSEAVIISDIKRVDAIDDFYRSKELPIRIDSEPPKIVSSEGTPLFAFENDKLPVSVTVTDDSPVAGVEMAFTSRQDEFKDPKPAQTLSESGGTYQVTFDLKDQPIGANYFVLVRAKDAVGNANQTFHKMAVTIGKRPIAMKPKDGDGAPVKNGSIAGTVRQGMTPREGVEVRLDKLNRMTRTGPDGRFRFADLPPDQYEISATYSAGGQTFTAMPQVVAVMPDKETTVSLGLK